MITKNFLNIAIITCSLAMFTSCSSDDDSPECHGCHLAIPDPDNPSQELMYDITNADGGDQFCADELADAESNTFYFEIAAGDSLVCDAGGHPIYAGQYGPGANDSIGQLYEVHCEDHGDHDDH